MGWLVYSKGKRGTPNSGNKTALVASSVSRCQSESGCLTFSFFSKVRIFQVVVRNTFEQILVAGEFKVAYQPVSGRNSMSVCVCVCVCVVDFWIFQRVS